MDHLPLPQEWVEFFDEDLPDLLKLAPYVRTIQRLYQSARRKRIAQFLRALGKGVDEASPEQKARFEKLLSDPTAQELLVDYLDSVVRSRSRLAIAALGLLFADAEHVVYSKKLKASAHLALDGASDDLLTLYLAVAKSLSVIKSSRDSGGPYPVYFLGPTDLCSIPSLALYMDSKAKVIGGIQDLVRRGLLAPDYIKTRYEDETWRVVFGFSAELKEMVQLLERAREILE